MSPEPEVRVVEDRFFNALLAGNECELDGVVAPEFTLIDMAMGAEIPRSEFLDLVGRRRVVFEGIERLDSRVQLYGDTAIVIGATRMRVRLGDLKLESHSRYTHVYLQGEGGWRMVTAQGTAIARNV